MCTFVSLRGTEILPYLEAIGRLRIRVFREYPYLYEGSLMEEETYLSHYAAASTSLITLALHEGQPIGATTCLRMDETQPSFRTAFEAQKMDLRQICYFGESVLLPEYRGRGIGKAFCQTRLDHARSLACSLATFCAVDRPEKHPKRPADYRPLDTFWQSLGFQKRADLQATFHWKEISEAEETAKTLTYWVKAL